MAFDACFLSVLSVELAQKLQSGKIEKIYQPSKNEIILHFRTFDGSPRLYINAGSQSPRIHITETKCDNPAQPPMFCMQLRKHLQGSKLLNISQIGFERAVRLVFSSYDEMGFPTEKSLICEVMGKYSNLMLVDQKDRILSVLHPVDFSMSQKRQVLPGMTYEAPPPQDKLNPLDLTEVALSDRLDEIESSQLAYKAIANSVLGIAISTAKQILFNAGLGTECLLENSCNVLSAFVVQFLLSLKEGHTKPCAVLDDTGKMTDFSFLPLTFYGPNFQFKYFDSLSELLDFFFSEREQYARNKTNGEDLLQVIRNAENRINKKRALQNEELRECEKGKDYRLFGDLLTANLYRLSKGMSEVTLENYYEEYQPVNIPLDQRLTPAANAQKYYKKYAKSKSAESHLTEQLAASAQELDYLASVYEEFQRAESDKELDEIRYELSQSGYYRKRTKDFSSKKKQMPLLLNFISTDGRKIICGKNNIANDYLTFHLAERNDWWFHAKNQHGAHVVMSGAGEEPTDRDFTEAAQIAAYYSGYDGNQIPVDYTKVKNVKKPPNAKLGYVIYHTNWTAYVNTSKELINNLKRP